MSTQSKHLSSVLIEKNIEGFTLTYHQRLILRHSAETPVCGLARALPTLTCFAATLASKTNLTKRLH